MGAFAGSEIDAWLRQSGPVVTASDRAARASRSAFNHARQTEGLAAWSTPNVLDWKNFVRAAWEEHSPDDRLILNPTQEQAIWAEIAGASHHLATLLDGPRHRLAAMAMEAHSLLCSFAPRFLENAARAAWQQDFGVFGSWLTRFDELCRTEGLLSPARLPLELISHLSDGERPPLLIAGFDRVLPVQRRLFEAWGMWREAAPSESATQIAFHEAPDPNAELAACAIWCARRLEADPGTRLLVVTQDVSVRRGEIERTFLKFLRSSETAPEVPQPFEFSLGIPLRQVPFAHGAFFALRWLSGPLQEHELDWLLSTGQLASSEREAATLQSYMRILRRRGLERTHWTLPELIAQRTPSNSLPADWIGRLMGARQRLLDLAGRQHPPLDWAMLAPQLLEAAGWPGFRTPTSAEFQSEERFWSAIETAGSLGFDGRRITWQEFLSILGRTLNETLFAPESQDAPIKIAGPAESAGLTADAIWFLGADENAWPASGPMHPLLPPEVQRDNGMPHGSPQLDWELARTMTARLLASAPEMHFSFARQNKDSVLRPSRLVSAFAGEPRPIAADLVALEVAASLTVAFEDTSQILFPPGGVHGGSSVLTWQSQCPFKAFASARLGARGWELAQPCLTPSQRGNLLHAVLHAIWSPEGIRSLDDLLHLPDRTSFVANHVQQVLAAKIPAGLRQRMPRRYLELEEQRLTRIVGEWLNYEAARLPFTVAATEADSSVTIAGLALKLRLDRIDKLQDSTLLVIDYKTGNVSQKSWELPRPDDVQLPLYAGFALDRETEPLGGLVFAKIRPGDTCFAGRVGDARGAISASLTGSSTLVRNPLTAEQLIEWRDCIEQLAREFIAGRADVDPREYPRTCERCDLQALCRVQENLGDLAIVDEESGSGYASGEAADE